MKIRLKKTIRNVLIILLICVGYYAFVSVTGMAIPCPFRLVTGKYCPGCGVTRMCFDLMRLDIKSAFSHNALVCILLPLLVLWWIKNTVCYIKNGKTEQSSLEKILVPIILVITIAFGIMRNFQAFSFLAP